MGTATMSSHHSNGGQGHTSYNLSAIFNYLPARFLKRKIFESDTVIVDHDVDESISSVEHQRPARPSMENFPGPFGFFTSAYMFGLFLMFVLLHRIQHTVVPVQRPLRPHASNNSNRRLSSLRRFLPTDPQATHAAMRIALHLPTLYLLSQKLLLWALLVIQTSGIRIGCCASLIVWAEKKEMSEVCWSTFVAICVAFCVEAFVRALDGQATHGAAFGMGAGENPNTSPFNLVGYAFLLHIYSSPSSHSYYPPEKTMPTRPDKHVVITIAIPLFQLTILHILSISKRFSTHRLLPTALSSFLSLTHFHLTLLSHFASLPLPSFLTPDDPAVTRLRNPHTGRLQTYPLLNYVPNVFETVLILSILLTHFLTLLTHLVLLGSHSDTYSHYSHSARHRTGTSRTRRQSKSIINVLFASFTFLRSLLSSLPYDEDFGVVLLRVGTQSLEAAAGRGWRNEVAGVYAGGRYFGGFSAEPEVEKEKEKEKEVLVTGKERMEYGSIHIGRADVGGMVNASITSATDSRSSASKQTPTKVKTRTKMLRGLRNEIRTLSSSFLPLTTTATEATETGDSAADPGFGSAQRNFARAVPHILCFGVLAVRLRALGRFVWAGIGVGWRVVRLFGKGGEVLRDDGEGGEHDREQEVGVWREDNGEEEDAGEEDEEEAGEEAYRRFLRGESLSSSDEEDGEYGSESEVDVSREDDEELDDEEEEDELYVDSAEAGGSGTAGQTEVLALLADMLFPSRALDTGSDMGQGLGSRLQDQGASLRDVLAHLLHSPSASSSTTSDQDSNSTDGGTGPMTRRRWDALTGKYRATTSSVDYGDDEERWLDQRRRGSVGRDKAESSSAAEARACVVCLAEVREVICWPCRCLAMCDGCREALAARSLPSKHRCPCCRQSVEGFSRIYVP